MAEISYPFSADNPTTGATKAVSELQWQAMAHMWGGDRVDFELGNASLSAAGLPFYATVNSVTSVKVRAGKAWVGGFHYENTAPKDLSLAANPSNTGRIDLIVVRVDMSNPSGNLAIREGTNAASPVAPQPVRVAGGIWEMPLWEITVPANGGTIVLNSRAPYNVPPTVAFPWNAPQSAALMPPGTTSYDLDNNGTGYQTERFQGRNGAVITRDLGPMLPYTPVVYNDSNVSQASMTRKGNWRWIAPGTVSFNFSVHNPIANMSVDAGKYYGISLPVPANPNFRQVFHGVLNNPAGSWTYPTFAQLTGYAAAASTSNYIHIYLPNTTNPDRLAGLTVFPSKSTIEFSGTYETNVFA